MMITASQITAMWNAYYRYYYADSFNPELDWYSRKHYNRRNIYDPSLSGEMQYGFRGDSISRTTMKDLLSLMTSQFMVCGTNNYIAYTFINPIITNFST